MWCTRMRMVDLPVGGTAQVAQVSVIDAFVYQFGVTCSFLVFIVAWSRGILGVIDVDGGVQGGHNCVRVHIGHRAAIGRASLHAHERSVVAACLAVEGVDALPVR